MVVDVPKLKLNNGLEMPAFGLGTYGVSCFHFHVDFRWRSLLFFL